jgi:hypothetical protein
MTANDRAQAYFQSLSGLPNSGGGGFHAAQLSTANYGRMAGLTQDQVFADIRGRVRGTRVVPDAEIWAAVRKAYSDTGNSRGWAPRPVPRIRKDALQEIIRRGAGASAADLWEASPIRPDWMPEEDTWRTLGLLYGHNEILFCGDDSTPGTIGGSIRPVGDWIEIARRGRGFLHPKFIPNPLTGRLGSTKDGKPSFRADNCIAALRFMVCEFDNIPLDQQLNFWCGVPHLPIAAITFSGKKSLHALVRVDAANAAEWETQVEQKLFGQFFKPLGLDASCKNESRLSRLPGHRRLDTGQWQKLLYLAPEGKAVANAP